MNKSQALDLDKSGELYVDWDDESGSYCIFGSESGFAYAAFADEGTAKADLPFWQNTLNQIRKR